MDKTEGFNVRPGGDSRVLGKGSAFLVIGRFTGRGFNLIGQILFARWLGSAAFGLYAIGWTILRILGTAGVLGLDLAVTKLGSRVWKKDDTLFRDYFQNALLGAAVSGIVLAAAVAYFADDISRHIFSKPELSPVLQLLAPGVLCYVLLRYLSGFSKISHDVRPSAIAEDVLQPLLAVALFLALWTWLPGLVGLAASVTCSILIAAAFLTGAVRKQYPEAFAGAARDVRQLRAMLAFGIPASSANLLAILNLWVDRLLVGAFCPPNEVGVYQAISQFAVQLALMHGAIRSIMAPMIARLHAEGQHERLEALFRVGTKWALYVSIPFFVAAVTAPTLILGSLFGKEFEAGSTPLIILMTGQLISVAAGAIGLLLVMTGNQMVWLRTSAISMALNILINVLLVPRIGIVGAAIGNAAGLFVLFGTGTWLLRTKVNVRAQDRRLLKALFSGLIAAAVCATASRSLPDDSILSVVLLVVLSYVAFAGALIIQRIDEEDRDLWLAVKRKVVGAKDSDGH